MLFHVDTLSLFRTTSLCSCCLVLSVLRSNSKYQPYSLGFDPPQTWRHDLDFSIFYLLKGAKRITHKLNKLMKSSPMYYEFWVIAWILTNIHAITLLLYSNAYVMPTHLHINSVYFVIFKWNIELLQIFIFELVQYTLYQYFCCVVCPH